MKEQSTTKGFAILSVAGIVVKVLSLIYIPFLLGIIGETGWGLYYKAYQIYVFIYVLTNTGIPVAISKLVSEFTAVKNYKDAVRGFKQSRALLIFLGIIMTGFMLLVSYPLCVFMEAGQAYYAVLALSPAIFFTAISAAYRGYFQGRGNMVPTAVSQIIEQVINTVFTLIFAMLLMKHGLMAGIAGGAFGTTLAALVASIYLIVYYEKNKTFKVPISDRYIEVKRLNNKELIRKILNYGFPITVCIGMTYLGNLIDIINTSKRLLVAGVSVSMSQDLVGYLGKYQQLINVPIAVITALAMAILPSIAGTYAVKDIKEVKSKINYSFRLCFLIAIPSFVGLAVLSKPIFMLIFPGKLGGAELMKIGAVVIVLMAVVQIQTSILQAIGKLYTATIYATIGITVKIIANYNLIAISNINIKGAVYGSIIAFSITMILNQIKISKSLNTRVSLLAHAIRPIIASAIMGIAVYFTYKYFNMLLVYFNIGEIIANIIATIISIMLGMYSYAYILALIGGLNANDLDSISSKIARLIPRRLKDRIRA